MFASTFQPGVLKNAEVNLEKSGLVESHTISSVLKAYKCFETRFVLENVWIRKNKDRQIEQAFNPSDLKRFKALVSNHPCVVAVPHNSGLYMLTYLVNQIRPSFFLATNPLRSNINRPTPVQKSLLKLYSVWPGHQDFLFIDDAGLFKKCCSVIDAGKNLIIAPDTPAASEKKVCVDFMGQRTWVASGAAAIAQKCQVDVLAVVPWAERSCDPYRLKFKFIEPVNLSGCISEVFDFFQEGINLNPACWSGWLYWDKMTHI